MKCVCHLSSVHPVFDTRVFFKECRSLAQAGYDLRLIAVNDAKGVVDGVEIIPFPQYKNRMKRILFSPLKMFIMAKKQQADIYHFHDPELLITGLLLRLFTKAKVIYDIHEDYSKNIIDKEWIKFKILRHLISKMFFFLEKLACRLMSGNVVVLSHWLNKYPKAVLVRNYPIPGDLEEKKDENLFVYVGTLGSKRSDLQMTLIFVELMQMIPGIKFYITGEFLEKKNEAAVMDVVNRYSNNITFLGYRPFPEVRKILSRSKYGFVLYSSIKYQENIPVKLYEYLAYGIISIFSSFDDFNYEIESEGWGIGINPKNPGEAAKRIYDTITDKEKIKKLEENIKHYRKKYSWESEKKELLNLYSDLINKK
ncbi:MAG: glycosyltransferase [Candidatus Aminicenantes bacterium]|nr:MAG: glycosyltransferase [Candidatus Aminicenantes bacterium]